MKKEKSKKVEKDNRKLGKIFIILTVIFLILTIITFAVYIISKNHNGNLIIIDMHLAGDENMLSKVDVSFITGRVATDKDGKSYYLIGDDQHIYLYAAKNKLNDKLEEIKKYTYQITDNKPEKYRVEGKTLSISEELKTIATEAYNNLFKESSITEDDFESYFGKYFLDDEILTDQYEMLKFIAFVVSFIIMIICAILVIILY